MLLLTKGDNESHLHSTYLQDPLMSWRILRSILFVGLANISLFAQSYQTQFTEVKFDRSKGPGTLHGPVEVEAATGAVSMNVPLGSGMGARGVVFRPQLAGQINPQAWSDPPFGIMRKMGGFTLHPGELYLVISSEGKVQSTNWTLPDGSAGSLGGGDRPGDSDLAKILTAFGYPADVTPAAIPHFMDPAAPVPTTKAYRGSKGELLVCLGGSVAPQTAQAGDDLYATRFPGKMLLIEGGRAIEFTFSSSFAHYQDIQASVDPAYRDGKPVSGGSLQIIDGARYRVTRMMNRFKDEIRFTYGAPNFEYELDFSAEWRVSGALKGSISIQTESGTGQGTTPFQFLVAYHDGGGTVLSQYRFKSLEAPIATVDLITSPEGNYVFRPITHQLQDAWSVNTDEHLTLTYGPGPTVSDPTYGYSSQIPVLSSIDSPGRRVELTWQPYLIRPNMTPGGNPGYRGSLSNKRNWTLGVSRVDDRDLALGQIRTTTHTRVVPVPTMGWSSTWASQTFYDAITHPDGQTVLFRYVEPIYDDRTVNQSVGTMTDTADRQMQTLAHLKHMVKEVRYYAAGVAWSSDLATAAASSTAYKVVVSDRWDLRSAGNTTGALNQSAVPFPTRTRTFETDTKRYAAQEIGDWDAAGFGWRAECSASQLTTSPDMSMQWQGLARQGLNQPSPPSGTQASRTTYKTFESDPTRWFLSRVLTEYSVVTDGTGYRDPKAASSVTMPTMTKAFNSETNTIGSVSVGGVDYSVQTAFSYNGTNSGSLASSQLSGVTVSGANLNLSGQVGIQSYGYDGFGFMSSIQAKGMSGYLGQAQDLLGRPSQQTDADGRVTGFQWDAVGRLTWVTPPGGEVATEYRYEVDHPDHLGVTIRRGSQESQLRYDGFGQLVLERRKNLDGSWNHRNFQYDRGGRKTIATIWRTGMGIDTDSTASTLVQDLTEFQCIQWKVLASGTEICTKSADVLLAPKLTSGAQWSYDSRGRETQVKDPNGVTTGTAYAGLVTTRTIANSTMDVSTTTFTRDVLGRLVQVVDGLSQTTNYFYHPNGKIGRVQQVGGTVTQTRDLSYTSLGWPLQLVQPESGTTTYSSFDVTGRPWATTYGAGSASPRTLTGTYNPLGQLLTLLGSGTGDVNQAFGYGVVGDGKYGANKPIWANANGVRRDHSYDSGTGRLVSLARSVDSLSWAQGFHYDSYGQLDQRGYPNHTTPASVGPIQTLGYDYAKGMPTSATYNSTSLATMAYDPTSWALTQISYANGASTSYAYWDDQARLKTMSMGIPGQVSKIWTYGYNQRGDVTTDGEDYYSYDKLSRLTQAFIRDPWDASGGTGATGVWQQFGYDAFGNRSALTSWTATNWTAGALPPATPTTDVTAKAQSYAMTAAEITTMGATNRLPSTIGGVATGATYDTQGNLTKIYGTRGQTATQVTMTYDALARVTSLGDSKNATSQAYLYDDEGLRIKIVDSKTGVTTYNIYNEARQLVATYTKTGTGSLTWKKDIVYVGSKEMAEVDTTGTSVTLTDHLGTPRYVWSGSGAPLKQKFLPFGESLTPPTVASGIAKGFTNHEQTDQSGLIYMQARYYLPQYGRFGSPDPARDQHFEETQSWNIYSYVRNMPTISIDPTGMLEANPSAAPKSTGNPDAQTARPEPSEKGPGIPNPAKTITQDAEKKARTNTPASPTDKPTTTTPATPAQIEKAKKDAQIAGLKKENDAKKAAADKAIVKNYLASIAGKTTKTAIGGATTGTFIIPGFGTVGGAIVAGTAGLAWSTVMGGIDLRGQFDQAQHDWNDNNKSIQNFSNMNGQGDAPVIRFAPVPTYNPVKELF